MSNPNPTHVVIVRPKQTSPMIAGRIVGGALGSLLLALIAWLVTPHIWADYPLSYWQTFGLIFVLRAIIPTGSSTYLSWSRGWGASDG